jgi:serine/threonine-protein kinase
LYLSPESLTSPESGDPRSDLYALGAVGYFLVSGRPVFEGASIAEVIGHHLHTEPVSPSQRLGRAVPSDLETVLMQCLRKRPDERPSSARELRARLRQCRVLPWTSGEAVSWWSAFRSQAPPAYRESAATGESVTVDVDLSSRVTRTAAPAVSGRSSSLENLP